MSDPNWPPPPPPAYTAAPTAPVASGELAGWGARAGATILDGLILLAVIAVLGVAIAAGSDLDSGVTSAIVLYYVALVIYAPLTMMRNGAHNGQTLGKQAAGIRVVRETGQPMSFGWAFLREIVCKGVLSIFTIPILLSYLWPLWDDRNQALHDKMASTLVVRA